MLTDLKLRDFRCFDSLACEFSPGFNFIVGPNAAGKTSLLEAVCVLLRLQSQRASALAEVIHSGRKGLVIEGHFAGYLLQFYFSPNRRKLALDSVVQVKSAEYLKIGRVTYFGNEDIDLARGPAEGRRRFLDFLGAQSEAGYRTHLRAYERALRSRNALLKMPRPPVREIEAYNGPLLEAGTTLTELRARLVQRLSPKAAEAQREISATGEQLALTYAPGAGDDFAASLASSRNEEARLRQTLVGPHRDDVQLFLADRAVAQFASEGQQRTIALALKLAQAHLIEELTGAPPLLLLDDIFGELDLRRREALLTHLPATSQKLVTTTHLDWMPGHIQSRVLRIEHGKLAG